MANRRVEGTVEVRFQNPTPDALDAAWFWLYPNRFATRPAGLDDVTFYWVYPRRFDPGWMRILSPRAEPAPHQLAGQGTLWRIPLAAPLPPGATATVPVRFEARIPERYGAFGCTGDVCTLAGGFYPMLAALDEAGWDLSAAPARSRFSGQITPAAAIDGVEGEWVTVAVGPPTAKTVAVHRGVTLEAVLGEAPPPADDARHQILAYTAEDRARLILEAAGRAIDLLPEAQGTLRLVEAPLRLELAAAQPGGVVLVSDRLFQIFPVEKFRKFHERELVRAVYEALFWRRGLDEAEVIAAWLTDLYTVRRFQRKEFASDFLRPVSFVPAVDQLLYAPQVAFVDAYFGGPGRDAFRDALRRWNHDRPGGRLLYQKLVDRLTPLAFRQLMGELMAGVRLAARAPFLADFQRPPAPVDLKIAGWRSLKVGPGRWRHVIAVEKVATSRERLQDEPIQVLTVDGDGVERRLRWEGKGSRGEVAFESASDHLDVIHLDPEERIAEESRPGSPDDPRFNDRDPPRLKFLYNSFGALLNVTDLSAAFLVDFELGRVHDTRNRLRLILFRSEALTAAGTLAYARSFGWRVTPARPVALWSVSVSAGRLEESFGLLPGETPRPGNRFTLSAALIGDDRQFMYEPLHVRGASLFGRGTVTRFDDGNSLTTVSGFADVTRIVTPWDGHTFVGYLEAAAVGGQIEERAQLLAAGGPGLMRGYAADALFTRLRATAHVEYRLALTHELDWNFGHLTWLRGAGLAFFADGGALSACDAYGLGRDSLFADVGAGVRFFYEDLGVAQGMMALDFGVPLVLRARRCLDQVEATTPDAGPLPFTIHLTFVPPF